MNEQYNLEFKEIVTKTFLKTVSAYSNYNDGEIIFGMDDNGVVVGLQSIDEERLKIENMINDSIDPVPNYKMEVKKVGNKGIIILSIKKGNYTPYYYRSKAYRRADTSTIEVDRLDLNRLVIEGMNINYEENRTLNQKLTFEKLELSLEKEVGLEKLNLDILKTLNLYHRDGYYNIAGELLADHNNLDLLGIDIVRFGENINQILYRETISNKSLLFQYDRAIEIFELYYQYEEIKGYDRIKKMLIPKEAFREAVANALVHRAWDINANILVSLYENRIEISSPGGLPVGISKEEYLKGNLSILRNPIIAGVFYRLRMIEKFGTGIARIRREYEESISKPSFYVSENSMKIILPVIKSDDLQLSGDEEIIYETLKMGVKYSRRELDNKIGFNKSRTLRSINNLIDKSIIEKIGKGPGIKYRLK